MQGRGLERRVAALEEAWGQVRAVGLGGGGRAGPGGAYPSPTEARRSGYLSAPGAGGHLGSLVS